MIEGVMLLWFVLTGLSVVFVVIDIPKTPESVVIKWAFVILTVFTGPLGAFFYVLGCREPLKGQHEQYVSATWRQVLGSTMHCAAGDGLGIIAGAAIGAQLHLSPAADLALEYALGFGFGWAYFQAFAMRDMAGGSYIRSLKMTFLPEFLSMNLLMAGMVVTMRLLMPRIEGAGDPFGAGFWFVMSMALIVGFALAYPINWWLVVRGLKHGMLTTVDADGGADHAGHGEAPAAEAHGGHGAGSEAPAEESHDEGGVTMAAKAGMTIFSILFYAAGIWLFFAIGG